MNLMEGNLNACRGVRVIENSYSAADGLYYLSVACYVRD